MPPDLHMLANSVHYPRFRFLLLVSCPDRPWADFTNLDDGWHQLSGMVLVEL